MSSAIVGVAFWMDTIGVTKPIPNAAVAIVVAIKRLRRQSLGSAGADREPTEPPPKFRRHDPA
jgi:hypothetical protein